MNPRIAFALVALLLVGANAAIHDQVQINFDAVQKLNNMVQAIQLQAGEPSQACNAAAQAFNTISINCGAAMAKLGSPTNLTNSDLEVVCPCATSYVDSIKAISAACGADSPIPNLDQTLNTITQSFRLTCLQYNGQYCFFNVSQSTAVLNRHQVNDLFTPAELDQICSPCYSLFLKTTSELLNTTSLDSTTKLLCVKNGGEYCYPKFQNFSLYSEQNPDTPPPADDICDRCIQKTLGIFGQAAGISSGQILNETASMCTRDGQNRLCSSLVGGSFEQVQQVCNPSDLQQGVCPADCSTAVSKLVTDGGCCAGNVVDDGAKQIGIPPTVLRQALAQGCNVNIPAPCSPKTTRVDFSFKNLKYEYYVAHKTDVDQKVIQDVAAQAGVPTWQVTVTGATSQAHSKYFLSSFGAGPSTRMSVLATASSIITTTITSTGDVAAIQADLESAQAAGTLSFPSVDQLPVEARVDPTLSAGATSSTSDSNSDGGSGGSSSGASLAHPSALLVLLGVVLALLV